MAPLGGSKEPDLSLSNLNPSPTLGEGLLMPIA